MADESSKDLLASLSNTRLPTLPTEQPEPREPSEPAESTEVETRGKSPEEVVQPRETPTEIPTEEPSETQLPAAPKKVTKKGEPKTYEIEGKAYTKEQLEEAGLLDRVIQTARQFVPLQKKYVEVLEQQKAQPPAKPAEEKPAEPPAVTNLAIAKAYDEVAPAILSDLLANNLFDEDFSEAYPRTVKTVIGQMRYAFDKIFEMEAIQKKMIERLEATISYLNDTKAKTEGNLVHTEYNKQLDGLVAKDAKLYAGLKDPTIRANFTKFLVEEVQANVGQTTGEKAPVFLAKQWVAFNATHIMDAAQTAQAEKQRRQDKRFVTGETGGSRTGIPDNGEKPLLDRLADNSGRIRE